MGGQPVRSDEVSNIQILDREVTVRFNTDVDSALPWLFQSDQPPVKVKIGQEVVVSFTAVNESDEPMAGLPCLIVSPPSAGGVFPQDPMFLF